MCVYKRAIVCVYERMSEHVRESACVCQKERESVYEGECVCVRESMYEIVCM